ncbi:MAG: hypothetical protein QF786_00060 [Vicinamibacterales bacterium]|jgi:hypothetical protein|nr:hypothetical protein [Vicinamibacterales bacterium]
MWVKIDDAFPEHEKFYRAGRRCGRDGYERAVSLMVQALCYASHHLTDGFVPAEKVARFMGRRPTDVASVLLDERLLELVDGGYQIHDFLDYQPTADAVKEKRRRDRLRKESARNSNGSGAEPSRSPRRSRARSPSRPVPSLAIARESRAHGARFADFWALYPLKKAKKAAERAWQKIAPGDVDKILKRVALQVDDRIAKRKRDEWVPEWPNPATWLNGKRWTDELGATRQHRDDGVDPKVAQSCPHDPICTEATECQKKRQHATA